MCLSVGFINPGSLADRLPNKGLAQADNAQIMGQPKYQNNRPEGRSNHRPEGLTEEERRPFSNSSPPLRPERSLRSPTHLWTASLTGRPGQSTTSDSDPTSPTGVCKKPCSLLFSDWRNQSQLGPTDRGRPLGEDQETNRASKAGHSSQTAIPRTIPYTPPEQYR